MAPRVDQVETRPPPLVAGLIEPRIGRLLALAAVYVLVAHVLPRPVGIEPDGWRITALFLTTIAGLMLQPLPGAAVVPFGLVLFVLLGGLPMARALDGFASPSVWLVLGAMLMSRVLRDTGVSRRIALLFVRRFGGTSLGVSYSLVMSDVTLGAGIPSITARSGGIVLPIALRIADLYKSKPGASAGVLGAFLIASLYQASAVACAMFFTGQASNVLAAGMAGKLTGVEVTWSSWFVAGLVPGLPSCLVIPYIAYRMLPPQVTHTPGAAEFARAELRAMGAIGWREATALAVFVAVTSLWVTSAWHGLDVTVVALAGIRCPHHHQCPHVGNRLVGAVRLGRVRLVRRNAHDGRGAERDRSDDGVRDVGRGLVHRRSVVCGAADDARHLLLCPLCVCQHHRTRAGHVSAVCRHKAVDAKLAATPPPPAPAPAPAAAPAEEPAADEPAPAPAAEPQAMEPEPAPVVEEAAPAPSNLPRCRSPIRRILSSGSSY